jgi:hypothetical protein
MFTPEMEMRIRPPSSVRGAMAEVAGDREVADNRDFAGIQSSNLIERKGIKKSRQVLAA